MNKNVILLSVALLLAGVSIGYFAALRGSSNMEMPGTEQADSKKGEILFYRNAMNPSVTSPVPAKDSMGMDYKPVYADDSQNNDVAGTVKIDPVVMQNIGVRTAKAVTGNLSRTIRAVGKVDYDEEKMARIHPKTEGWIEKLFVEIK